MSSLSHHTTVSAAEPAPGPAPVAPAEIDASCRLPVLFLTASSVIWLVIGSLLAVLASLKFHRPTLLAECPVFTYGRIQAAQSNLFLYGFASQVGIAFGLWLLARLSRTSLVHPLVITIGGIVWNLGVTFGLINILSGQNSGFEWLEFPRNAAPILFYAFLAIGLFAMLTFHNRRVTELYPSQWFLFGALLWFPWIYGTATQVLLRYQARGVFQSAVNLWYGYNFSTIWLGFLGLAAIFYLWPQTTGRPLYSRTLAMFTFWALAIFGTWGGIPSGSPLPAWMPSLSTVMTVLTVVPVLSVAVNCYLTSSAKDLSGAVPVPLSFIRFAVFAYLAAAVFNAAGSVQSLNEIVNFTFYVPAIAKLHLYGFFAMTAFAAIYYMVPKLAGLDWPLAKLGRLHLYCATGGVLLYSVPLAIGGYLQGLKLNDAGVNFSDVTQSSLTFLRVSILGDLFMLIGSLLLLVNLIALFHARIRACCCSCCDTAKGKEVAA